MSAEPQKMKITQALQICKDIVALHKTAGIGLVYSFYPGYKVNRFNIRIVSDESTIEFSRYDRALSSSKRVPCNLWTILIKTAGNYKMDPVTYYLAINNNGSLPHAPKGNYFCSGLAAHIIYHKMKKEYKLAKKHEQMVR